MSDDPRVETMNDWLRSDEPLYVGSMEGDDLDGLAVRLVAALDAVDPLRIAPVLDAKIVGFCDSEVTRLHEMFGCLEPKGHLGHHSGPGYYSACPACGALDRHAKDCPTSDLMEDTSQSFIAVDWDDSGNLLTWKLNDEPAAWETFPNGD